MAKRGLLWGCLALCLFGTAWAEGVDPKLQSAKATFLTAFKKKTPPERVLATTALGEFPRKDVVDLLLNKGCVDTDPSVRFSARKALTKLSEDRAIRQSLFEDWQRGLKKTQPHWADLLRALAATADDSQQAALVEDLNTLLSGPNADLRTPIAVIDDYADQGDEQALTAVKLLLRVKLFETNFAYRRTIVQAAARIKSQGAIGVLIDALEKSQGLIQSDIVVALTRITGQKFRDKHADWKAWWEKNEAQFEYPSTLGPPYDPNEPHGASFYGMPICAKRVVLILDTSSSMRGVPIEAAKKALLATIESLPEAVYFDVIVFDEEVAAWKYQLVPASREAKAEVSVNISNRSLGPATSSFKALRTAFDLQPEAIYFLSDGQPTDGTPVQIIEAMSYANRVRRISIFTVGVVTDRVKGGGEGLTRFMAPLSERNWGEFLLVE